MNNKEIKKLICAAIVYLLLAPAALVTAHAASATAEMAQFQGVTVSPDGSNRAWTTDYGDKTDERLPGGYTIETGIESSLPALQEGEHYYSKEATGSVPIGKWVVIHSPGHCIHDTEISDSFAGFPFESRKCGAFYNNGWCMYCADCGEPVRNSMIYAKSDTVRNITSVPASSAYVYLCPYCNNLEQGFEYQHVCKDISYNRYRVTYRNNTPVDSTVTGYMSPTLHMYENSTTYNGRMASEFGYTDTRLRKNSLRSKGYVFVGWNTKPDGSGQSFTDGQEVLNLTSEENGTVRLYAQWKKSESTLVIDAEGGTYNGKSVFEKKQKYATTYQVDIGLLMAPEGYRVSFVTNGGSYVADITTTKSFSHWELGEDFQGEFAEDIYRYVADHEHKDTIKARHINDNFTLPDCKGDNFSLVGWYDSPDLKDEDYVGNAGDEVSVSQDTVLYAKWAQLTLWAYDNYDSYGGSGAVNLKWEQKDGKSKYYRLFQSLDKVTWKEIYGSDTMESSLSFSESFTTAHKGKTYTIPYTGNYTLTANGGKGADYNSSLVGGKGGSVSATYWLLKGDTITVYPGSFGSGQTGGTNGSDAEGGSSTSTLGRGGGAASIVYVTRNGTKTLLLVAGGGGGANGYASGGAGGTGGGNGTISNGASGIGGGGGGKVGGLTGEYVVHHHSGSSTLGGGCYTAPTYCDGSIITYKEEPEIGGYYAGCCGEGSTAHNGVCIQCGHNHSGGSHCSHPWYMGGRSEEHICSRCGQSYGSNIGTCNKRTGYILSCGMQDGQTISAKASYGGTNYIADAYGCKNQKSQSGINDGNGTVTLKSADIGYLEVNKLDNVKARDTAKPDKITSYKGALSGDKLYRVTVQVPKDNGTLYYHRAESYENGTITRVADSNITKNILVSGIAGYRYYMDENISGTVTGSHNFTAGNKIDITMKSSVQYLHISAVDVAGNIGPAISVTIPSLEDETDKEIEEDFIRVFPPMTDLLNLKNTDSVYEAGTGRYFVKADGNTEHTLSAGGYLENKATNKYQVDTLRLVSENAVSSEWYEITVPKASITAGDRTFTNEELQTNASLEKLILLQMTRAEVSKTDKARVLSLTQYFTVSEAQDSREILIYPRAESLYEGKKYQSNLDADRTHALVLIPDGKAPDIYGVEALQNSGNIDMTETEKYFTIYAADAGSGIRNLSVTITNLDNHMVRTYSSDIGSVIVTMNKDDYLFLGNFVVTAEAVDNVDNHKVSGSDTVAFTLEADIRRSREPYDGDFKAGDGAVLTVTTGGYADKVIIRFPEELISLKPDLNKEYVYEFPYAIRTEKYEFNIPLGTADGDYTIEVEAWKSGEQLTTELEIPIKTAGSITDEFRTRIRNNGV